MPQSAIISSARCCDTLSLPNHRPLNSIAFVISLRRRSMDYRQLSKTLRFALSVAVVALLCGGAIGSASPANNRSPIPPPPPRRRNRSAPKAEPPCRPSFKRAISRISAGPISAITPSTFRNSTILRLRSTVGARHAAFAAGAADHRPHPASRREGPHADDYDAPRWTAGLASLKPCRRAAHRSRRDESLTSHSPSASCAMFPIFISAR